ncbi:MAG: serine hydrolase domain-containing protein, partial [Mycobacterium sp.]
MSGDALTQLSTRIRTDIAAGKYYAAAIAVARDGKVVHREDIGIVDPRSGRPAAPDDIYLMMSLSKSFTAALVLRAIDEGRFTFSTKVADILPMFSARGKNRVTIQQLLTHTAGTYSGWAPPPPMTMQDIGQLRNTVDLISTLPAAYTPGTQVVYNPFASYSVLGQILVDTDPAGRSFAQIAEDDLFSPVGMSGSSFGLAIDHPRRVPVSVPVSDSSVTDGGVMESLNVVLGADTEFPAGGAFAPVSDVLRFAEMLRGKGTLGDVRVLSKAIFEYACKNHTGDMVNGFWDFNRESHDIDAVPANFTFL